MRNGVFLAKEASTSVISQARLKNQLTLTLLMRKNNIVENHLDTEL